MLVLILAGLVLVAGVGFAWWLGVGPLPDPERCSATVSGRTVTLSTEQAENAALIAAIAVQRELPARAASIALATAYQESKIVNIEHGDRDSIGLFQQRPSQGWGTRDEILNPVYAINAFYDALVEIDGSESMRITEAAQFSCVVRHSLSEESDTLNKAGLTHRAGVVRRELEAVFGDLPLGGFDPDGVRDGHMPGSAHYEGRAIDVFVRPISPENKKRGWAIAYYLVAQADRLAVDHVIFDNKIWSAGRRSEQGWRDYDPDTRGRSDDARKVLEHRDHVHVDVVD